MTTPPSTKKIGDDAERLVAQKLHADRYDLYYKK